MWIKYAWEKKETKIKLLCNEDEIGKLFISLIIIFSNIPKNLGWWFITLTSFELLSKNLRKLKLIEFEVLLKAQN